MRLQGFSGSVLKEVGFGIAIEDPSDRGLGGRTDLRGGHLDLTSTATAQNRTVSSCCTYVLVVPE